LQTSNGNITDEVGMIKKITAVQEVVVTVSNKAGVLADMAQLLANARINVEAVAGYADKDNTAKIMFITKNNLKAIAVLKKAKYSAVTVRPALIVEMDNKPGALACLTEKLAIADIDIKQTYGTTVGAGNARLVVSTADPKKTAAALKK
jgi:hypothetical protein